MDRFCEIHAAEACIYFGAIEILALLEDQHLGMIVKSEGFLGILIVDNEGTQRGICFEDCYKIESEPALKLARFCHIITPDDILPFRAANQLAIIQRGQRITLGQARDLPILVVGGDEDVIRLVNIST